ncbi:MAG: trypsin-like peptidase domain-containing protein [Hydrogenophaga sp.]|uniref:trypsin-like peptidase domain-containing protein n=1 Tax=Hydrogenophaga sp. TaxID=1904254 RepID=UPI00257BC139|nr:trypsin-like peptidase domain-containing protein [Hydrogenophaga sp.]MBL0945364.1 trypsin-like peptidase domain-containing protein [Hydrogenophaga sp.]
MRQSAKYSPSRRAPTPEVAGPPAADEGISQVRQPGRLRAALARQLSQQRLLWLAVGLLSVALIATIWQQRNGPAPLTQKAIDAAVLRTLTTQVMPSPTARAAEKIRPSVVRVLSYNRDKDGKEDESGVGTGVVIVDKGVILTNLHVVQGADRLKITFADGTESGASVTGAQPENDLAVLQAHTIPDDLSAATMRSTADLVAGDGVVAVGFPFGIGPSVSAGVISGFKREFKSPEGKQVIGNLIQFDAAANPGNSGGPLVTMDGEVVGIVTGILNPTSARTFVGIGFAVPIESAASAAGLPPF